MLTLDGYWPSLLGGMLLTLNMGVAALLVATLLGLVFAVVKVWGARPLVWLANVYTTIIRGTPDFVILLIVFYGGQLLLNDITELLGLEDIIEIDPYTAGVAMLGLIYGAYMTETFRGAILAVPHGQLEAGRAYGMRPLHIFRRVLMPQMMRHALPGYGNNWLVLIKATALVSVIGLEDMVKRAQLAAGTTHKPFDFYLAVALLYLVLTSISIALLRLAERRFNVGFTRR